MMDYTEMFLKVYYMLFILGLIQSLTLGIIVAWFINHKGYKEKP